MKGGCPAPLALLVAVTVWASLSAARPDESRPPANLHVEITFRLLVGRMWKSSPTFRRQCRRLAADPSLVVTLSREDRSAAELFADAWTTLAFKNNKPVAAQVHIKAVSNGAELIAHELEHIIEQLDGVDLQAQDGNGTVWRGGDRKFFETRRAVEAGRRTAREMMDGERATQSRRGASDAADVPIILKLQDHESTPLSRPARVSSDGRLVVFTSLAQLVPEDRNQKRDVYVTDLASGRTTLESIGLHGASADADSGAADISTDGRYVVFESEARNLTATLVPSAAQSHVFVRDRVEGTTRLLTTNVNGEPAERPSHKPVISANGRFVVLESGVGNLIGDSDGGGVGIYLIDLTSGTRTRIDRRNSAAADKVMSSMSPSISADGRYVAFASKADLTCRGLPGCPDETVDRNHLADVYVYDRESRTTTRVSRAYDGSETDGASYDPAISGDGRVIAFVSEASNVARESKGRTAQIYVSEFGSGRTELVSQTPSVSPGNGSSLRPSLSFDGSTIVFQSLATNLLCERKCPASLEDINLLWDVFARDRTTHRTVRISRDGGDEWMELSCGPSIDGAGRVVAFGSWHPTGATDTAHDEDLYVVHMGVPNADF